MSLGRISFLAMFSSDCCVLAAPRISSRAAAVGQRRAVSVFEILGTLGFVFTDTFGDEFFGCPFDAFYRRDDDVNVVTLAVDVMQHCRGAGGKDFCRIADVTPVTVSLDAAVF